MRRSWFPVLVLTLALVGCAGLAAAEEQIRGVEINYGACRIAASSRALPLRPTPLESAASSASAQHKAQCSPREHPVGLAQQE